MDEATEKQEFCLQGIGCAPGVAHGKAFVFLQKNIDSPCYKLDDGNVDAEVARFYEALKKTKDELQNLANEMKARASDAEAEIFAAHLLVLEDPVVVGETEKAIRTTKINAEHCFNSVSAKYIEFFSTLEDNFLRERAADIRDVSQRVLKNLLGLSLQNSLEKFAQKIVVAEELTPSETLNFEKSAVAAILTDGGNHTSHAAIVARAIGIPAVVGLRSATLRIEQDADVLVDGEKGLVYINPTKKTLECYEKISVRRSRLDALISEENSKPDVSLDGAEFHIEANISGTEDLEKISKAKVGDVGLFRSEGIFLRTNRFPEENQQFEEYRKVVDAFPRQNSIVIRTLDIGGDKQISSGLLPIEENPFMGFRAIRFCLEFREIFKDQLRAILRTSTRGNVKIMFPMISSVEEFVSAKEILEEAKNELRSRGENFDEEIKIGSMIEVPAAVSIAEELANEADFLSIGTNDLTQYLLAVDRGNEKISHLYDSYHPAVIRAISHTIDAAKNAKIPCAICGEMAGEPNFAPLLLGLGATSLSMSPNSAPKIRYILRNTSVPEMKKLAEETLKDANPRSIQERLTLFINSILPLE